MRSFARWVCVFTLATSVPAAHAAETDNPTDNPWSATVYFGPSTTKYFGAVLTSFDMQPTGTMFGFGLDRNLLYLGYGIHFGAELEATQYFFGHPDTTYGLGLGFRAQDVFGLKRTSFAIYSGPSYADNPPYTSIGYGGTIYSADRVRFLNFVAIEFAVGIPHTERWYGVFRIFHRSGAFGLYSIGDDDGMALGLGVQYRF